jgi:hypothetical protein
MQTTIYDFLIETKFLQPKKKSTLRFSKKKK